MLLSLSPPLPSKHKTQLIIGQTDLYDLVTKKKILHHFLKTPESNPIHLTGRLKAPLYSVDLQKLIIVQKNIPKV
jgi:hypothetical protein